MGGILGQGISEEIFLGSPAGYPPPGARFYFLAGLGGRGIFGGARVGGAGRPDPGRHVRACLDEAGGEGTARLAKVEKSRPKIVR